MYCIINFLSILVATSKKQLFFHFKKYVSRFFAAHELQSTALDPDDGLFISYQMPADKHQGLKACLCLLPKDISNFAEFDMRSAYHTNHGSNTEYYESNIRPRAFITSAFPYPFKMACVEQFEFELCLNGERELAAVDWSQPN